MSAPREERRCIECGATATAERAIDALDESGAPTGERVVMALCAEHAAELDAETDETN